MGMYLIVGGTMRRVFRRTQLSEEVMENESSVQSRFLLIEMLKFHLSIQLMISLRKSILLMMMQKKEDLTVLF
jgi:hypothetical protein